jgi:hypothetical protein
MFIRYALSVVVPATALLAMYLMLSTMSCYLEATVGQGAHRSRSRVQPAWKNKGVPGV